MINPYVLGLLFDKVFTTIENLSTGEIKCEYWRHDRNNWSPEIDKFFRGQRQDSLFHSMGACLRSYFHRAGLEQPSPEIEHLVQTGFISQNSKVSDEVKKEAGHNS